MASRNGDNVGSAAPPDARVSLKILSQLPDPYAVIRILDLPLSATVGELKHRIQHVISTHPPPSVQRLIYKGRVMGRTEDTLAAVFGPTAAQTPEHVVHLVVRDSTGQSISTPPPAVSSRPVGNGEANGSNGSATNVPLYSDSRTFTTAESSGAPGSGANHAEQPGQPGQQPAPQSQDGQADGQRIFDFQRHIAGEIERQRRAYWQANSQGPPPAFVGQQNPEVQGQAPQAENGQPHAQGQNQSAGAGQPAPAVHQPHVVRQSFMFATHGYPQPMNGAWPQPVNGAWPPAHFPFIPPGMAPIPGIPGMPIGGYPHPFQPQPFQIPTQPPMQNGDASVQNGVPSSAQDPTQPRVAATVGGAPATRSRDGQTQPLSSSPVTAFLLSSPNGPHAIVYTPQGTFRSVNSARSRNGAYPSSHSSSRPPSQRAHVVPVPTSTESANGFDTADRGPDAPAGGNADLVQRYMDTLERTLLEANPGRDPNEVRQVIRQMYREGELHRDVAQRANPAIQALNFQGRRAIAIDLTPIFQAFWLFIRVYGVMWVILGGTETTFFSARVAVLLAGSVVYWAVQAGYGRDWVEWARNYWDNLLGFGDPEARRRQADQPGAQQPNARPPNGLDAGAQGQNSLREALRPVERTVALFFGSLYPGVGERHVAERERVRREEAQREVDRARAAAVAAQEAQEAAEAQEQARRHAGAGPGDDDGPSELEADAEKGAASAPDAPDVSHDAAAPIAPAEGGKSSAVATASDGAGAGPGSSLTERRVRADGEAQD